MSDSLYENMKNKFFFISGPNVIENEEHVLYMAKQIKEIMGSKPAARKYFKDIKAVSTTPNGRFNTAMIILKAF